MHVLQVKYLYQDDTADWKERLLFKLMLLSKKYENIELTEVKHQGIYIENNHESVSFGVILKTISTLRKANTSVRNIENQ